MNQRPYTLPPDVQRLVSEPFNEPPARARAHWKALDKAMQPLERLRAQKSSYEAEIVRLRGDLALAKQRDEQALAEALTNDQPEPESEAAAIEKEIERNIQRSSAMTGKILEAQRAVTELVLRNKDKWLGDMRERHLLDKAAAYRLAVVELDRARAELVAEVNLGAWIAMFPATGGQPQTHNLPASPDLPAHLGGPSFPEVLGALRRDVEQLPQRGPVRLSDASLRELDRQQLIVQSSDAQGNVRHQVLETNPRFAAVLERLKGGGRD